MEIDTPIFGQGGVNFDEESLLRIQSRSCTQYIPAFYMYDLWRVSLSRLYISAIDMI